MAKFYHTFQIINNKSESFYLIGSTHVFPFEELSQYCQQFLKQFHHCYLERDNSLHNACMDTSSNTTAKKNWKTVLQENERADLINAVETRLNALLIPLSYDCDDRSIQEILLIANIQDKGIDAILCQHYDNKSYLLNEQAINIYNSHASKQYTMDPSKMDIVSHDNTQNIRNLENIVLNNSEQLSELNSVYEEGKLHFSSLMSRANKFIQVKYPDNSIIHYVEQENAILIAELETIFSSDKMHLACFGVGHLYGDYGILKQLIEKDYIIKKILFRDDVHHTENFTLDEIRSIEIQSVTPVVIQNSKWFFESPLCIDVLKSLMDNGELGNIIKILNWVYHTQTICNESWLLDILITQSYNADDHIMNIFYHMKDICINDQVQYMLQFTTILMNCIKSLIKLKQYSVDLSICNDKLIDAITQHNDESQIQEMMEQFDLTDNDIFFDTP